MNAQPGAMSADRGDFTPETRSSTANRPASPGDHERRPEWQDAAAAEDRLFAAARAALRDRDWAEATRRFTELLSSSRYAAEARYGLGWIELQLGSPANAAARFREATRYDPQHANAWYGMGRLAEGHSAKEATVYYRQALVAKPGHRGAAERLRLIEGAPDAVTQDEVADAPRLVSPAPPATNVRPAIDERGDAPGVGHLGVVDFLRRDKSAIAQDTLARIESLNRTNRFRITAHLQQVLQRLVLLVGSAGVIAYVLFHITPLHVGGTTIHFYSNNVTEVISGAAAIWGLWTAWVFLDCVTNSVTFANGRMRWTRGVINKHVETLDIWTARDIELDRNLVQRITRDGALTFKGTLHDRPSRRQKGNVKPLRLTGVDRGQELDRVYALLLDLKFLLRANQGIKGIVQ